MSASLARRFAAAAVAATAAAVAVAAVAAWFTARSALIGALDEQLRGRAAAAARRGVYLPAAGAPGEAGGSRGGLQQAFDLGDGRELFRSPALDGTDGLAPVVAGREGIVAGTLSDGRAMRVLAIEANVRHRWERGRDERPSRPAEAPPAGEPAAEERGSRQPETARARLLLAVDASDAAAELRRLAWILLGVGSGATAAVGFASLWLRRAILRPVARVAAEIRAIDPGDLARRVTVDRAPSELAPVVERLNDLLARVEAGFGREKQTIAALAHELRTPVAGLRTTLEFAVERDDGERARTTYHACLGVVLGLQAMIANLLALARIEAGQTAPDRGPCDAAAVVRAAWAAVETRASERGIGVDLALPDAAPAAVGSELLRIVALNLLDNLVAHARAGTTARVELVAAGAGWRLSTANGFDGPAPDAEAVFRPFWRGDPARQAGTHCGLGLALCQRIVRLLGGAISAASDADRFRVVVDLPAPGHDPVRPPS